MVAKILSILAVYIKLAIDSMGYGGVVLLMGIESACIPLPSEIIMPFAGSLVYTGRFTLHVAALAGAIGCIVGSIPAYYLGQYGGRPLIERYGKYILLSHHELDLADRLFARWGQWVARMNMTKFIVYTFVGSYPWCYGLAWVGMKLGEKWDKDPRFKAAFHRFDLVIGVLLLAGVAWFVWHKLRSAKEQPAKSERMARAAGDDV